MKDKKYTGDPAFRAEIEKVVEEHRKKEAEAKDRKIAWINRKDATK